MKTIALLTTAAALGYASTPKPTTGDKPAAGNTPTPTPAPTPDKPKAERVAPVLTDVLSLTMPTPARAGGAKSAYPFDTLQVGQAFGVKNKTQREVATVVSVKNRKHRNEVTDPATGAKSVVNDRHYFAYEVTDAYRADNNVEPDVKVLVFRDK